MFIINGPVLFLGRAKSAESAAKLLRASYPKVDISFYDDNSELSDFKNIKDLVGAAWSHVVVSPGFPQKDWFSELSAGGAVFTQELDIAAAYLKDEKIYVITGSVGKSTCAWIAEQVFKKLEKKVFLGGNFGIPLADYALKKLMGEESAEYIVLEMSSYQIERMAFMIDRALILNLIPNHLDRYPALTDYYDAKLRIIQFCREGVWAIEGGDLSQYSAERGITGKLKWIKASQFEHLFKRAVLIGKHNRANLAAVLELIASPLMDEAAVMGALNDVEALPHRIECFDRSEIHFVNDSKATTMDSILTAYTALREKYETQKIFWLLGGRDKKLPWHKLKRLWTDSQLGFVFFGEAASLIQEQTGFHGQAFPKLEEALDFLKDKLLPGDLLVLSPGGTSLDEFKSFEDRGNFFKNFALANF